MFEGDPWGFQGTQGDLGAQRSCRVVSGVFQGVYRAPVDLSVAFQRDPRCFR